MDSEEMKQFKWLDCITTNIRRRTFKNQQSYLSIVEDKDSPMEVPHTEPEPTTQMAPEATVTSRNQIKNTSFFDPLLFYCLVPAHLVKDSIN